MRLKRVGLAATAAMIGFAFLPAGVAIAAAPTFTLTESATTMTYGGLTPSFRGTLTLVPGDPGPGANTPLLVFDSAKYAGSVTGTAPTFSIYWSPIPASTLAAGSYPIYATFQSSTSGTISSNTVTLTVAKTTPQLQCTLTGSARTSTYSRGAGYPVQVGSEWAGDPFTIKFTGAQTFSSGPFIVDSSGVFTAAVPRTTGVYQTTCIFDGTASLNSVSYSLGTTVVSLDNQPGGIALFASPTPITSGTSTTWRVVVSMRAGLPLPTGTINLFIGSSATRGSLVLSGGSVTFTAAAPPFVPTDRIEVFYYGDTVYSSAVAYFPLNPPPIPAAPPAPQPPLTAPSQPSAIGAGPLSQSPSPSASAASPSPSSAVSSPTQIARNLAAGVTSSGGVNRSLVIGLVAAIVVVVIATATVMWRRRRSA